ncbi:MAG: hypothetical protein AAGI38_08505 [Bacteroidota bacterium]
MLAAIRTCLYSIILVAASGLYTLNAQEVAAEATPSTDTTSYSCELAEARIYYYFMAYTENSYLNPEYLEKLYYACSRPSIKTSMAYYYFRCVMTLNLSDRRSLYRRPPRTFNYFYQQFASYAPYLADLEQTDPEFANVLLKRATELEEAVELATQAPSSDWILNVFNPLPDPNEPVEDSLGQEPDNPLPPSPAPTTSKLGNFTHMPFPPIAASTSDSIPQRFFKESKDLGAVAEKLRSGLLRQGYTSLKYYSVPGGFALVTGLEKLDKEGGSLPPTERFSVSSIPDEVFSLRPYEVSMVFAQPGNYRLMTFVLAPRTFFDVRTNYDPMHWQVQAWQQTPLGELPSVVSSQRFTSNYELRVMVYQYKKSGDEAPLLLPTGNPSVLPARVQLERAGVWRAVQQ